MWDEDDFDEDDEFDDDEFEDDEDLLESAFEGLHENIKYFDFDEFDLGVLKAFDIPELIEGDNLYVVTPLLNQIANYAILYEYLNFADASVMFEGSNCDTMNEILDLCEACSAYMTYLEMGECEHPTVIKYSNLLDGVENYNDIMNNLHRIRTLNILEINVSLMDLFNQVYAPTLVDCDMQYYDMWNMAERIKNPKLLAEYLAYNAVVVSQLRLLLLDRSQNGYSEYVDSDNILGKEYVLKVNYNNKELVLMDAISFLTDVYESKIYGNEVESIIIDTMNAYKLFKNEQFNYLKFTGQEKKVLSKCKKR